jgi:homoserine dehydrogenase
LAEYGQELFETSAKAGLDLFFEGSVAGGIPIIKPLKQSLVANNIEYVMGIVNGTTNYILTRMSRESLSFKDALAEAQELGYAEADLTADVGGFVRGPQIAILASLAFHTRVKLSDVYVEVEYFDNSRGSELCKGTGTYHQTSWYCQEEHGKVEVRVHPL